MTTSKYIVQIAGSPHAHLSGFLVLLIVVCGLVSCMTTNGRPAGAQNQPSETPKESATVQTNGPHDRELVLSVENPEWVRNRPLWINLEIRNPGKNPLRGVASFGLVRQTESESDKRFDDFWAPVYIENSSVTAADRPVEVSIAPDQELKLKIDLQQLKWGRSVQSVWPGKDLFSVVPKGNFSLHFEINSKDGRITSEIKSNEVRVSIP